MCARVFLLGPGQSAVGPGHCAVPESSLEKASPPKPPALLLSGHVLAAPVASCGSPGAPVRPVCTEQTWPPPPACPSPPASAPTETALWPSQASGTIPRARGVGSRPAFPLPTHLRPQHVLWAPVPDAHTGCPHSGQPRAGRGWNKGVCPNPELVSLTPGPRRPSSLVLTLRCTLASVGPPLPTPREGGILGSSFLVLS